MELLLGFNTEVLHNSCNPCTCVLPDMCTLVLGPVALGIEVYISGRILVSMLQLLNITPQIKGNNRTTNHDHMLFPQHRGNIMILPRRMVYVASPPGQYHDIAQESDILFL